MSESEGRKKSTMRRREFLANLLFASGALSVTGFQLQAETARKDPKDEGWQLPSDWKDNQEKDGWELPEDLFEGSDPPPNPPRPPKPPPPRPGDVSPPHIRGKVAPPRPPKE